VVAPDKDGERVWKAKASFITGHVTSSESTALKEKQTLMPLF